MDNIKTISIIIAIGFAVWFYKDYENEKRENKRQKENIENLRRYDSLKHASQTYNKDELEEFLDYSRQDLKNFLKEQEIRSKQIKRILTQNISYRDTTINVLDLKPVLDAINQKKEIKIPIIDSSKCLIIKGYIAFKKDTLSLDITERNFTNKSDVISYWKRKKWSFLGIKTRFLGRKEAKIIIKDSCGKTETFIINSKD